MVVFKVQKIETTKDLKPLLFRYRSKLKIQDKSLIFKILKFKNQSWAALHWTVLQFYSDTVIHAKFKFKV